MNSPDLVEISPFLGLDENPYKSPDPLPQAATPRTPMWKRLGIGPRAATALMFVGSLWHTVLFFILVSEKDFAYATTYFINGVVGLIALWSNHRRANANEEVSTRKSLPDNTDDAGQG